MNLADAVTIYKKTDGDILDNKKNYYESLSSEDAIIFAAQGKDPDGSLNSHQHRIGKKKANAGADELKKYTNEINECQSFEEIFKITEKIKTSMLGLGDLWSYDTALRIGFNKKLYPRKVYIQRGVVEGAKKVLKGNLSKGRSLPLNIFPQAMQDLEPYKAENFLCIYGKDKGKSNC